MDINKLKNSNKKKVNPLVLGAAGIAIGVGAAAAAVTYKRNKKFQKTVDHFIDDAKEQSLNYAQQVKDRFQSSPQAKKIEKKIDSKKSVIKKKV